MGWKIAQPEDRPALQQFIIAREWQSVVFSSSLKEGKFTQPYRPGIILRYPSHGTVTESIMLNPWGSVLPVLSTPSSLETDSPADSPIELLTSYYPLHSVMGLHRDVCLLEKKIPISTYQSIDYFLLTLEKHQFTPSTPQLLPRLVVQKASSRDLRKLLPLQVAYEKEEVCLDLKKFSTRVCQYNLKKNLNRQIIFWARKGHQAIAKAGTNALGYNTAQLGGIYTLREKRNRGIAFRLLKALLDYLFTRVNTVCLFVKPANTAAITLYNNLGFTCSGQYRITYFCS